MKRSFLLPVFAGLCTIFAGWHVLRAQQRPPAAQPASMPARSPFQSVVAGAGVVEARTQNISLGSPVAGLVAEVFVKVGERVPAGRPLFVLDTRHVRAELAVREASCRAAEMQLAKMRAMPRPEELPASEAKIQEAAALVAERNDALQRTKELFARRVVGKEELVKAEQAFLASNAQAEKVRADDRLLRAGAWKNDVSIAEATVLQAKSQVEQSRIELSRHLISAPRVLDDDGRELSLEVMQVNVRPGEYAVAASTQPLLLLGNVEKLHVRVDIDEHDIPRFRGGEKAIANVRGAGGKNFPLKFNRVEPYVIPKKSLTGESGERIDTRVLQVIFEIEGETKSLYVGQQMDVFVEAPSAGPASVVGAADSLATTGPNSGFRQE